MIWDFLIGFIFLFHVGRSRRQSQQFGYWETCTGDHFSMNFLFGVQLCICFGEVDPGRTNLLEEIHNHGQVYKNRPNNYIYSDIFCQEIQLYYYLWCRENLGLVMISSFTLKRLGHFVQNVILFSHFVHHKCNIFIWNWSNTMTV